jgi:hypothetical protein
MIRVVKTREGIERACDLLAASSAPHLPLWRAAADGLVGIVCIADPARPWPGGTVKRLTHPIVAIVGGDVGDGARDPLPEDWLCARRLREWCATAIVHGAGGEPEHYREAVRAAELTGRCAFIETTSDRARAWADYLRPKRTLVIVPRQGVHPIPAHARVVH